MADRNHLIQSNLASRARIRATRGILEDYMQGPCAIDPPSAECNSHLRDSLGIPIAISGAACARYHLRVKGDDDFLTTSISSFISKVPFDNSDTRAYAVDVNEVFTLPIGHGSLLCIYLVVVGLSLTICCRQLEYTTRRLFLWQKELDNQKQKVS